MAAIAPSLPPLAFGNAQAESSDDLAAFTAAQRSAIPAVRRYEPLRSTHSFHHRAATIRVRDVRLVASASTPLSVAVDGSTETTLLVPFHGWSTSVIDGREYRWQAGGAAIFLPGTARAGESGVRSMLAVSLDPHRLEATARAMLGPRDAGRVDLGLDTPRLIPLGAERSPALAILRQVLPLIDMAGGRAENLQMLGLDDMVHRFVALMLAPRTLARSFNAPESSATAAALRSVTEYIVGHLEGPITLTDLERVSGLAARTLQVAFRRSYNCTPREWIQRRRLLMARERLLAADPRATVASIAASCGFTRLGTFTAAYARRFGELPSATLAGGRRP